MLPWLATNVLLFLALFLTTNEHELHESIRSEFSVHSWNLWLKKHLRLFVASINIWGKLLDINFGNDIAVALSCYRRWRRLRSVTAGASKASTHGRCIQMNALWRSAPSPYTFCSLGHPSRVRFSHVQYRGYAKAHAPVIERWRLQRHLKYKILNLGQLLYHCFNLRVDNLRRLYG